MGSEMCIRDSGGRDADPQRLIDLIEVIEDMDDVRELFSAVCD